MSRYLQLAYKSRRAWRREVTHNRHGLAHLALRILRILAEQIEIPRGTGER